MAGYFFRAQELLDCISNNADESIKRWLAEHEDEPVSISVIGLAAAQAEIAKLGDSNEREEGELRLTQFVSRVRNRTGSPLPFDDNAAAVWQRLISAPQAKVPHITLQEYAIAATYGLIVVEAHREWHAALVQLGIVFDVL